MFPFFSISVHSIVLLSIAVWGATTSHADDELAGQWKLVAAEFAGKPFDALNGSTLVLSSGQKTFTLPGGVIETGEYSLDLKHEPKQIDSTTKGRAGTAKGIYKIDGKALVMCLSQSGTSRPSKFATTNGTDLVLLRFTRQQDRPDTTRSKPTPSKSTGVSVSPKGTRPGVPQESWRSNESVRYSRGAFHGETRCFPRIARDTRSECRRPLLRASNDRSNHPSHLRQ